MSLVLVYFQLPQSTAAHIPWLWHAMPQRTHIHTLYPPDLSGFFEGRYLSGCEGSSLELNWIKDSFFFSCHLFIAFVLLCSWAWLLHSGSMRKCSRASKCVCVCTNSPGRHLHRTGELGSAIIRRQNNMKIIFKKAFSNNLLLFLSVCFLWFRISYNESVINSVSAHVITQ